MLRAQFPHRASCRKDPKLRSCAREAELRIARIMAAQVSARRGEVERIGSLIMHFRIIDALVHLGLGTKQSKGGKMSNAQGSLFRSIAMTAPSPQVLNPSLKPHPEAAIASYENHKKTVFGWSYFEPCSGL
jgi:hypothetical protein